MRKIALIVLVLALLATSALAADPTATPTARIKVSGFDTAVAISSNGGPGDVTQTFSVATGAVSLSAGDYIALCKLPKGAVITDYYVSLPDLDSSTTLTLNMGTGASPGLLIGTPIATGQAGGIIVVNTSGVMLLPAAVLTAEDYLRIGAVASANGTPPAGGTIRGWITYNMRGAAF